MKLPIELQHLCEQYLEQLKQDSEHTLSDEDRLELYLNFGSSRLLHNTTKINLLNFTVADFALSWLAFLSAKKVTFICHRGPGLDDLNVGEAEEVKKFLGGVEDYLSKKITFKEAENISQEYWYFHRPHLTYDVLCAWRSSMYTLEFVLYGTQFNAAVPGFDFFVLDAVKAYSVIDLNLPGKGDSLEPPIPLEHDKNNRLKFWEWWLSEAIPQAWELAHRSS